MRNFTSEEKLFIESILSAKKKGSLSVAFKELELPKLLRSNLETTAISWEVDEKPSVTIYSEINTPKDIDSYFNISGFLYLIEELEEARYIKIAHSCNNETKRLLYDRDKYAHKLPSDIAEHIKIRTIDKETGIETETPINEDDNLRLWRTAEDGCILPVDFKKVEKINLDIAGLLEDYADGIIYPLPLLEDYVNHDYQTIEQRQFQKQLNDTNIKHKQTLLDAREKHEEQMCWTRWSLCIAFLAVIVPSVMSDCSSDAKIIKNAILDSKTEMPTRIEVFTNDTLNVQPLNLIKKPKKTISTNNK